MYFVIISSWNDIAFVWNNFPLLKDALCQVWLKLAQLFWRRRWKCKILIDRETYSFTDERWAIRKAPDGFQLRWSKELKQKSNYSNYENLIFFLVFYCVRGRKIQRLKHLIKYLWFILFYHERAININSMFWKKDWLSQKISLDCFFPSIIHMMLSVEYQWATRYFTCNI